MAKAVPMQESFNGGEFSPLVTSQVSLPKRATALETCKNMIALKQGAATRRGGTSFIKEVKDSTSRVAIREFVFSTGDAFQIEIGDQYFRFYKNNQAITHEPRSVANVTNANPCVVQYSGSDTYTNGDEVFISGVVGTTEINNRFFKITNINVGLKTFEIEDFDGVGIDSTNFGSYVSGGTVDLVYEVSSPYTQAQLFDSNNILQLHINQSADVLYLFNGNHNIRSLNRISDNSWALRNVENEDGPYIDVNTTSTTLTLSGTTGSVTVTASSTTGINNDTGFQTTDVGRLIRFKDPANEWTWLEITAYISTTSVTATIKGQDASAGTATTEWRLGAWSDTTGWPVTGTFFQDRFCAGGPSGYPDRVDLGKTGGYSDTFILFSPTEIDGSVSADNAISKTLPSRQVNQIQWMESDITGLILGTTGQEWTIRASSNNEAITPSNAKPDPISTTKSAFIQPVLAESGLLFVQSARRKIFDMIYSFDLDRLKPRDVSVAAEHITISQITSMAYQQEPLNVVWMVRGDGQLIGLTYYPDENVIGFHRHILGGSFESGHAVVEDVSVVPSSDNSRDELMLIVKRTINGVTKRYVEYMTRYYEDEINIEDAFHVDCGLTYGGAATSTLSNLHHLEGETLRVMVDGKSHPDLTVQNGSVTLANDVVAEKIQIGFAYSWALKTLPIEAGARDGTAQGKTKRIHSIVLQLLNTLGLKYGTDDSNLDEIDFNTYKEYDETPVLFTGNTDYLSFLDSYNSLGQVYLTGDGVFPVTVKSIIMHLNTQDR